MIKRDDRVSWIDNTGESRREPQPGGGQDYIIIPGKSVTLHGRLGDLLDVFIPVIDKEEGVTMKLYKDLKLLKNGVSYAFKLPDTIRIVKGTEGNTDEEETIKGKTIRRVGKVSIKDLLNVYLPVIGEDGTERKIPYRHLKMEGKK